MDSKLKEQLDLLNNVASHIHSIGVKKARHELSGELGKTKKANDALSRDLKSAKASTVQLEGTVEELSSELRDVKKERGGLNRELMDVKKERDALSCELGIEKNTKDVMCSELCATKKEMDELRNELFNVAAFREQCQMRISELERELVKVNQESVAGKKLIEAFLTHTQTWNASIMDYNRSIGEPNGETAAVATPSSSTLQHKYPGSLNCLATPQMILLNASPEVNR